MGSLSAVASRAVQATSPRHRRYRRLLDSCLLDPSFLPEPVTQPGDRDVIICGCPRSGTALLTAALHQPPVMATVMEPWDGLRLEPDVLFTSLRHELAEGSLTRGRLDLDTLSTTGEVVWQPDGAATHSVAYTDDTLVGVKWPTYWQYLPLLPDSRFVVCVRHPYDVLRSFTAQGGRLADGFDYEVEFNGRLNAEMAMIDDVDERRLAFYDRVYGTVLDHLDGDNVHLVHYERWATEPDRVLDDLSRFLDADLRHSPAVIVDPPPPEDDRRRRAIASRSLTAHRLGYL